MALIRDENGRDWFYPPEIFLDLIWGDLKIEYLEAPGLELSWRWYAVSVQFLNYRVQVWF